LKKYEVTLVLDLRRRQMDFLNKRDCLRRLELRTIVTRLNSSLPGKFGAWFTFFDMAVLSQVSELI